MGNEYDKNILFTNKDLSRIMSSEPSYDFEKFKIETKEVKHDDNDLFHQFFSEFNSNPDISTISSFLFLILKDQSSFITKLKSEIDFEANKNKNSPFFSYFIEISSNLNCI